MMIIIMVVVVMREKNMYVKENKMRETVENLVEGYATCCTWPSKE